MRNHSSLPTRELQQARWRCRQFGDELFREGTGDSPVDRRGRYDDNGVPRRYGGHAAGEAAHAAVARSLGIHGVMPCRLLARSHVGCVRSLPLLMRGHRRRHRTQCRLRRVAEQRQPRNQKARDEFGPHFHESQYRRCRGASLRSAAGPVACWLDECRISTSSMLFQFHDGQRTVNVFDADLDLVALVNLLDHCSIFRLEGHGHRRHADVFQRSVL